ncbi:MAG: hypothetical protein K9J85_10340 [Desulfobacteraceae bacterium]|nr:hypothetical protein [Desulfobacteraceae bacterium]
MIQWHEISANRRALAYIIFSAVVLGTMFMLGILPALQQIGETEKKARHLEAEIEKQKIFKPLYRSLQQKKKDEILPKYITGETGLKTQSLTIENVSGSLYAMAESAGIKTSSFSPVPDSMTKDSDKLLVNGRLQGEYQAFKDFLISLTTSRAFWDFELLEVKSAAGHPEYRMQMWVTVE